MSVATIHTSGVARTTPKPSPAFGLAISGALVSAALIYGWRRRGQLDLVADDGLGYGLGVVGLALMTSLLLYSLRKRWTPLRNAGATRHWLHVHMMLGLLGPTAILYHANFRLGSLNSRAALFCMLVVSGSGVIGRFLYTRIHHGYLDQRESLAALKRQIGDGSTALSAAIALAPSVAEILAAYERAALPAAGRPGLGWLRSGIRARQTRAKALRAYRKVLRAKPSHGSPPRRSVARALRRHLGAMRRVARFSSYERAFALWHAFHLPFCIVLFGAAAVHVVAVHMY